MSPTPEPDKKPDPAVVATEVLKSSSIPPEAVALIGGVQAIFQNIGDGMKATAEAQAKAQIAQSDNQTKVQMHAEDQLTARARIASTFLKPFFWCAFGLYGFSALLALVALYKGEKELTEKIIIGLFASLFSLLAGIGISKKQS